MGFKSRTWKATGWIPKSETTVAAVAKSGSMTNPAEDLLYNDGLAHYHDRPLRKVRATVTINIEELEKNE